MERFQVQSSQASLACFSVGTGSPVVFLHAGVADHRSWEAAMAETGSTHRAIAYDRRGFGSTEYSPEPHSAVEDLLAVLETVGDEPPVLVGNSQGGRIAIDLALRNPARLKALVLVGPAISGWPPPTNVTDEIQRLDEATEAADERGDMAEVNRLEAHMWLDGPMSPEGRVGGRIRELFLEMNGRALAASDPGEAIEPPSAYERLTELTMPVLVIMGDLDEPFIRERAEDLAKAAPAGRMVVMEGTAHLPQLEQPERFNALLRTFLDEIA